MAAAEKISPLRGLRDVLSAEYRRQRRLQDFLAEHLRLHNYAPIDPPLLENTELYLRKSGEDIAARLYDFHFKSRRIALRPEMTASVLRAYVEHLQDEPLPLRLQYSGPVFRYEKPQQRRYRQFTVSGAELLGASGPYADAEMLYLAASGLQGLGLRDYQLVIGHSDVLAGFLRKLGLRKQLQNFLLRNMENLRKRGLPFVLEALRGIFPEFELAAEPAPANEAPQSQQLINVLRAMSDSDAQEAIGDFLHSLNIRIDSGRGEAEIIDRLLRKIREAEQGPKLRVALEFMQGLSALQGPPAPTLRAARALAAEYQLATDALSSLEKTLRALTEFGELSGELILDFGLNRGLHYYTGLIFEIHCPAGGGETVQLCGGGRYDNLISILGGSEPTPAAGFACGLERIAGVVDGSGAAAAQPAAVCVIPVTPADFAAGQKIAQSLRARAIAAEVDGDTRSLRRRLKQAHRRGAALVIIIGETERQGQQARLRDMRRHSETRLAWADLPAQVERQLQGGRDDRQ